MSKARAAAHIPDQMIRYMTWELAEMLGQLSAQQVAAINRIIQAGHLVEEPPAPWHMLSGADAICNESTFYATGRPHPTDSSRWARRPGWSHQPEFMAALNKAKQLARAQRTAQSVAQVQEAVDLARENAKAAVQTWIDVMQGSDQAGRDRNDAAGRVLELARGTAPGEEEGGAAGTMAADWWQAAADNAEG